MVFPAFLLTCFDHQVVQHEEALCAQALTLSWGLVRGLATNPHDFWLVLKRFVSAAFQHELLRLSHPQAPTLVSTLKQVIRVAPSHLRLYRCVSVEQRNQGPSRFTQICAELMELSQTKSGVFGVLLEHCCHTWMPTEGGSSGQAEEVFSSVFSHVNILAEACVHGPVFRRDQRCVPPVWFFPLLMRRFFLF